MAEQRSGWGARGAESVAALRPLVTRLGKRAIVLAAEPIAARRARRQPQVDPATWGLVRDDAGALCVNGMPLRQIAEHYGSPLHVVDSKRLGDHVAAATSAGFDLAGAHRCTHVTGVIDLVRAAGCWISTASTYELDAALAAGVEPGELLHAPAVLSSVELDRARRSGVGIVCASSPRSFDAIGADVPSAVGHGRVGLTVAIDEVDAVSAEMAAVDEDVRSQITHLHVRASRRRIAAADLDTLVDDVAAAWAGVAACLPLESLSVEVDLVPPTVSILGSIDARLNRTLGLPVAGQEGPVEVLAVTLGRFHDRLLAVGVDAGEIIIDPGSIITGGMQCTLATVLEVDETRSITHVVLDCGINVADDTLVERHELLAVGPVVANGATSALRPHRLVGPICTPADVLYANWWMAPTAAGDVVAIMDTGGPYVAESTTFSFPRPAVVVVSPNGDVEVLRNAETFEDLVALDSFEPDASAG